MNVISKNTLIEFWKKYPDTENALTNWLKLMNAKSYASLSDMQTTFSDVEKVGNRYVFNIRGNHYRLICRITFPKTVFLRAMVTHEEYDKLNKQNKIGDL